jgi:anti-anti-sigma regulatory factor
MPGAQLLRRSPRYGDATGALNDRRDRSTLTTMDGAAEEGVRLSDDGGLLTLPEHMDIRTAPLVHEAMCTALRTAAGLHIEGHLVQRVDGAGLQLLCALFLTAGRRNFAITWRSTSAPLIAAARVLGVEVVLGIAALPTARP